jgi:hypothetical protein
MLVREEMHEIMTILPKGRAFLLTISPSHHTVVRCTGQNAYAYGPHDAAILIVITVLLIRFILLNRPHGNILCAALIRMAQLLNKPK